MKTLRKFFQERESNLSQLIYKFISNICRLVYPSNGKEFKIYRCIEIIPDMTYKKIFFVLMVPNEYSAKN